MELRHLIEALRGGSEGTIDPKTGKTVYRHFSTNSGKKMKDRLPKGLRDYQLHNQEATLGIGEKESYAEWEQERK